MRLVLGELAPHSGAADLGVVLDEDIVDAHSNEIDADCVVLVQLLCELQLGADAIGPGDQDGLPEAVGRQCEHPAEAAEAGQHFRPVRLRDDRLYSLYERLAGVDIDARVFVGKRILAHLCPREARK